MEKLDLSTVPKNKKNPILKGLSSKLKDPDNYESIEKQLSDVLKTDHKHKKPSEWLSCEHCQMKFQDKKKLQKKLGFKSSAQYLEWRKVMDIIINKKNFQVR